MESWLPRRALESLVVWRDFERCNVWTDNSYLSQYLPRVKFALNKDTVNLGVNRQYLAWTISKHILRFVMSLCIKLAA